MTLSCPSPQKQKKKKIWELTVRILFSDKNVAILVNTMQRDDEFLWKKKESCEECYRDAVAVTGK